MVNYHLRTLNEVIHTMNVIDNNNSDNENIETWTLYKIKLIVIYQT